jgi:hypothetical protein
MPDRVPARWSPNRNALKHGDSTAEVLALKRQISALARMVRETMEAIE